MLTVDEQDGLLTLQWHESIEFATPTVLSPLYFLLGRCICRRRRHLEFRPVGVHPDVFFWRNRRSPVLGGRRYTDEPLRLGICLRTYFNLSDNVIVP